MADTAPRCATCGSENLIAYETHTPHPRGVKFCLPECIVAGRLCLNCRMWRRSGEGAGL